MFILFGTKPVKRRVKNGQRYQRYCSTCGCTRELEEFRWANYFTLYFIPLFPIQKGESVWICPVCDSVYNLEANDYEKSYTDDAFSYEPSRFDKVVINCIYCSNKMRIPDSGKLLQVTCPRCKKKFEVRLDYKG